MRSDNFVHVVFVFTHFLHLSFVALSQDTPETADNATVPASDVPAASDAGLLRSVFRAPNSGGLPDATAGGQPKHGPEKIAADYVDANIFFPPTAQVWPGLPTDAALDAVVSWEGRLHITGAGDYSFELQSEGPSKFFIGSGGSKDLLVDHPETNGTRKGGARLESGHHEIRVEFDRSHGPAAIAWRYAGPDTQGAMSAVPPAVLSLPRATCETLKSCAFGFRKRPSDEDGAEPCFGPVCTAEADVAACCVPRMRGLLTEVFKFTNISQIPDLAGHLPVYKLTQNSVDIPEGSSPWRNILQRASGNISGSTDDADAGDGSVVVRWSGQIGIKAAGLYSFKLSSMDGSRLILDNQYPSIVDNDGIHNMSTANTSMSKEGTVKLTAGFHMVQIDYFQKGSAGGIQLLYKGPDSAHEWTAVNQQVLFQPNGFCCTLECPVGYARKPRSGDIACHGEVCDALSDRDVCCVPFAKGLLAEIFLPMSGAGATIQEGDLKRPPASRRLDEQINFPPPAHGIPPSAWSGYMVAENFAVRWSGHMLIDHPGHYTFELAGRSEARLYIDDVSPALVDLKQASLGANGLKTDEGDVGKFFQSGMHRVTIEYIQPAGAPDGSAALIWRYTGPDTHDENDVVPPSVLFQPRANCTNISCPTGFTQFEEADALLCFGTPCTGDMDMETCCFEGEAAPQQSPAPQNNSSGIEALIEDAELVGTVTIVSDSTFGDNPEAIANVKSTIATVFNVSAADVQIAVTKYGVDPPEYFSATAANTSSGTNGTAANNASGNATAANNASGNATVAKNASGNGTAANASSGNGSAAGTGGNKNTTNTSALILEALEYGAETDQSTLTELKRVQKYTVYYVIPIVGTNSDALAKVPLPADLHDDDIVLGQKLSTGGSGEGGHVMSWPPPIVRPRIHTTTTTTSTRVSTTTTSGAGHQEARGEEWHMDASTTPKGSAKSEARPLGNSCSLLWWLMLSLLAFSIK